MVLCCADCLTCSWVRSRQVALATCPPASWPAPAGWSPSTPSSTHTPAHRPSTAFTPYQSSSQLRYEFTVHVNHGRMNYKDIEPATIDQLTDFEALCLTDFIDWRYIHSLVGIFDPPCELLPPCTKELYLCTVAPLPSLWPSPPLPN